MRNFSVYYWFVFLILDLFGRVTGLIGLEKPHITFKAKVFRLLLCYCTVCSLSSTVNGVTYTSKP